MNAAEKTPDPVIELVPEKTKSYVPIRDFSEMIGEMLVKFQKNKVITDFATIQKLLAVNAPIVELGKQNGICLCPNCNHVFQITGRIVAQ